jgi:Eukaryotic glutathione synthase, ATP binding domain
VKNKLFRFNGTECRCWYCSEVDRHLCLTMADPTSIYTNYPPPTTTEQEEYLVQSVKDWSIHHGLVVRPSPSFVSKEADPHTVLATNAPVSLFPSPFPQSCFAIARDIQTAYNELYAAIANDEEWLEGIVKEYEHFLTCTYTPHMLPIHSLRNIFPPLNLSFKV